MRREEPTPPGIERLHRRLQNWGSYHNRERGPYGPSKHAGSAEGRYIPERLRGDTESDRRSPGVVVDVSDAELVDMAWRRILVVQHKLVLRFWYIDRQPDWWILRRIDRRGQRFNIVKLDAMRQLQRALDDITCVRYDRANS